MLVWRTYSSTVSNLKRLKDMETELSCVAAEEQTHTTILTGVSNLDGADNSGGSSGEIRNNTG